MLASVLVFAVFHMTMNVHLLNCDVSNLDKDVFGPDGDFASVATDRPWLVIHIGPPKTGTTTIQKGLTLKCPSLANHDNIFFLGQSSSTPGRNRIINYVQYTDKINDNNGTLPLFSAKH